MHALYSWTFIVVDCAEDIKMQCGACVHFEADCSVQVVTALSKCGTWINWLRAVWVAFMGTQTG